MNDKMWTLDALLLKIESYKERLDDYEYNKARWIATGLTMNGPIKHKDLISAVQQSKHIPECWKIKVLEWGEEFFPEIQVKEYTDHTIGIQFKNEMPYHFDKDEPYAKCIVQYLYNSYEYLKDIYDNLVCSGDSSMEVVYTIENLKNIVKPKF